MRFQFQSWDLQVNELGVNLIICLLYKLQLTQNPSHLRQASMQNSMRHNLTSFAWFFFFFFSGTVLLALIQLCGAKARCNTSRTFAMKRFYNSC